MTPPLPGLGWAGATVRNALEVARFGGLRTGEEPSEHVVVERDDVHRLRRYGAGADAGRVGPPILLVPPLMLTAEVYDVSPQASAVTTLQEHGADPWVVDFGHPEREPGGLERTLEDHVLAVSGAVDVIREATGSDVHLSGYSQGGMFAYQAAALRRGDGVRSLITFGSPVDVRGGQLFGFPEQIAVPGASVIVDHVLRGRAVPGWATREIFRLLDPIGSARSRIEFLLALHDRESLLPREGQRRFLMHDGWVAWPGPALADFTRQFLIANRMVVGGFSIGDRAVSLADIHLPVLTFVGESDEIAPPPSVRAIRRAAPEADVHEVALRAGHFGLVVGRAAQRTTWPVVAQFARWAEGDGPLPEEARPVGEDLEVEDDGGAEGPTVAEDLGLLLSAGGGALQSAATLACRAASTAAQVASDAVVQLPRLQRLARSRGGDRISLGRLLAEQVRRTPDREGFLFQDRTYSFREADQRVDAVVRGLLELGVRAGEPVGVLLGGRPSALALTLALSRVGAIAVMLRPGADVAREADLGGVRRIFAEPDLVADVPEGVAEVTPFLLADAEAGTEPGPLELREDDGWRPPAWYEPDRGRSEDVAAVLFTGALDDPRALRVTNGRLALAAFATAAAAALGDGDTVYAVAPLHHPSGLLTGVGGALAGGARLAMALELRPDRYWAETRRYGITVITYTWAQLRTLLDVPRARGERDHPVRLFVGSGLPAGLWRDLLGRFPAVRVLELWTMPEGEAVLANVAGTKVGAQGWPLPGSADVALVRWDLERGRVALADDGYAVPCADGEVGLLLARGGRTAPAAAPVLRDVLAKDDVWISSGSLFRRDADGDHWLLGSTADVVLARTGPMLVRPISEALSELGSVALAVTYRWPAPVGTLVAAAVQLREGATLTARELEATLDRLEPGARPHLVHVVDEVPVTPWQRPVPDGLVGPELPRSSRRRPAFVLAEDGRYRPLTAARREALAGEHRPPE